MSDGFSSESQFHRAFERYLREKGIQFVTTRMDRPSTTTVGDPDYWILSPALPALGLELKMEKGRLSAAQQKRHRELTDAGFRVHVARSIEKAMEFVEGWTADAWCLAPRRDINVARFGESVYQWRPETSSWQHLRKATGADVNLPNL